MDQRAWAAFWAASFRWASVIDSARAFPPLRPCGSKRTGSTHRMRNTRPRIRCCCQRPRKTTLTQWALAALQRIYQPRHRFVKAGVMLMDLRPKGLAQGDLFATASPESDARRDVQMQTLDRVNAKWGRGTLGIASAGLQGDSARSIQRGNLSPAYSTRWSDLRVIGE